MSPASIPRIERVAIAASSFAPHKGGVEELVHQLAREQLAADGSPTVLTMRWPKTLPAREVIDQIPVRRFVYRSPEGDLLHRALAAAARPIAVAAVASELRRVRAQVVHIQCVSSGAFFVARAALQARLPLVVTLQGELTMDATGVYQRSGFMRSTLLHLLQTADAVTACSRDALAEAEGWAGFDLGERGSVVYNGVRVSDFDDAVPLMRARPYVFAIGRHVHQKGFDVLLDAFAELSDRKDFRWDLVLAGDGPDHGALRQQAERLGVSERVEFLGATDRPETAALFRGSAVFVLASRHEPFGIVNLEAMAAGRPVVATSVGGVPEFVLDGRTGLLVPPEDPAAMAAAIRSLHDAPGMAAALGAEGRSVAARFDWSEIEREYQELYVRVVDEYRRRP